MPSYTTLISASELQALQASGAPLFVFDCSFDLAQPQLGGQQYLQGHIPGALHADLDLHLSAGAGRARASGGRHPLPTRADFATWLTTIGFANGMQAVVYDQSGVNYCVRLWWMFKWAGHEAVAVLDGGLPAWKAAGGALAQGQEAVRAAPAGAGFSLGAPLARLITADEVLAQLGSAGQTVIDARAPARYRGEVEPLDPVAGHIPGALNRPFTQNLADDGRMKSPDVLRAEFGALLAGRPAASVVHQCGSGVTATPNLLAMELAGLGRAALFAGSWSEWCADPARPVERG